MQREQLSAYLQQLKHERAYHAEDIANLTQLHEATVHRVLRGSKQDSMATYLLVSCALGFLPPSWREMLETGQRAKKSTKERAVKACEELEITIQHAHTRFTRWDIALYTLLIANIIVAGIAIWVLSLPS